MATGSHWSADTPREKIVFLVRDQPRRTQSYTWRIWARSDSFYVKPRYAPVAGFKVSLHGPRAGGSGLWKVQQDRRDRDAAAAAGGAALHGESDYRVEFAGRHVRTGVRLAVRIRVPWTSLTRGSPSGPSPGNVKLRDHEAAFHGVLAPPAQMRFVDVDIYVSDRGQPYWPRERELDRDRAKVGCLVNDAGQHLTAVSFQRGLNSALPREPHEPGPPTGKADAVRGVGIRVVDELLWLDERIVSRQEFAASSERYPDR